MTESQQSNGCNLIPPSNTTFLIAQNWENVPETFLLNFCIGFILYGIFLMLTKYAWNQTYNDESYMNHGLISFLYGYRDPDRWFVIPRFEFLRQKDSHHVHDPAHASIYVPPKLPQANPIEILTQNSQIDARSDSSEDTPGAGKASKSTIRTMRNENQSILKKMEKQSQSAISPSKRSMKSFDSRSDTISPKSIISRLYSPSERYFYPSILTAEQLQASYLSRVLNKIFSTFFRVTDADIIYAKGIDAYEYLLFQRHLICIMLITSILCLGIILPIHWLTPDQVSSQSVSSFQRTTIKNMPKSSILYWAHIVCSVIIVVASVLVMSSYRSSILTKDEPQLSRRTVLIGNIPQVNRNRPKLIEIMSRHFKEATVEAIQFVYDTTLLDRYLQQLSSLIEAKNYCIYYKSRYNRELMVRPSDINEEQRCNGNCRLCSFIYVCACRWPFETKRPGTEFYSEREAYYRKEIEKLFLNMMKEPSEYAFVTLKSYKQTRIVLEDLARIKAEVFGDRLNDTPNGQRHSRARKSLTHDSRSEEANKISSDAKQATKLPLGSKFIQHAGVRASDPLDVDNNPHVRSIRSPIKNRRPPKVDQSLSATTTEEDLMDPVTWSIRYAPHPDNVEYADLLNLATTKRYSVVLLHGLMVVIFLFFTTPNVVLSMLNPYLRSEDATEAILINYVSILIQIITTALLPSLITLISKQIPYEDTASKNHSIMWKVYLFLVLMVIIMPSIGMSSAQALIFATQAIEPKCLFPTDNGAYYVNYVVTSIFLSTILELIKPVDILSYCFILLTGRSIADYEGGRQFIEREFSVGMQHTSVLLVFSAVMTYAISCPLITPVGLLYLIVKHAVDHYHLFYVYFTKKVDKNLQTTIVVFVRVALLLMLFQTTVAISLNTGTSYFSFTSQIVFCITLAVFICNFFLYCTSETNIEPKRSHYQRDFCACFYLPRAIEDLIRLDALPRTCLSRTNG